MSDIRCGKELENSTMRVRVGEVERARLRRIWDAKIIMIYVV